MVKPALANKNSSTEGYLFPIYWKKLDPPFHNLNKETKCLISLQCPGNGKAWEVLFDQSTNLPIMTQTFKNLQKPNLDF